MMVVVNLCFLPCVCASGPSSLEYKSISCLLLEVITAFSVSAGHLADYFTGLPYAF